MCIIQVYGTQLVNQLGNKKFFNNELELFSTDT